MSDGSAFQARGPVMENALSVTRSRVRETTKLPRTLDRSRVSSQRRASSDRYCGAVPVSDIPPGQFSFPTFPLTQTINLTIILSLILPNFADPTLTLTLLTPLPTLTLTEQGMGENVRGGNCSGKHCPFPVFARVIGASQSLSS